MAEESFQLPSEQNLDYHIVQLFDRLEGMRREKQNGLQIVGGRLAPVRPSMQAEIRTVEFWRSIISECLASFLYVFIVCGAAAGSGVGASVSSVLLATALAAGFTVATLTQCFAHISGAHINPAVTLALTVTRSITPLRTVLYITAQCGGGIAGAALLYGVTVPGYQGNLQAAISHSSALGAWERFGVEFILTFTVVLAYFVSTSSYKRYLGSSAMVLGAAYSACSFVSMPYLNPARSLGPSFVLNKWDNHWVYWFGPLCGGAVCGLVYEYIFNQNRSSKNRDCDNDSSSVQSDDEMDYHVDMKDAPKFQGNGNGPMYNGGYQRAQNVQYAAGPPAKVERAESIYGGTRSMYCKSPPLTRANLNRSQSVYAKSQTAINRDLGNGGIPRPGPLVPAQSLYPLRVTGQNSHVQNQNMQNQMNQVNRSESIYGIRSSMRQPSQDRSQVENQNTTSTTTSNGPMTGFQPVYGTTRQCQDMADGNGNVVGRHPRIVRPESMYGTSAGRNRGQSAHSDDSSYGSYQGTNSSVRNAQQQQLPPPPPMCGNEDIPMQAYASCPRSQQQQQQQQHQQQQGKGNAQVTISQQPHPEREQRTQQQQQQPRNNYMTHQDIYGQTPIACPPPPPPLQHQYAMHSLRQS